MQSYKSKVGLLALAFLSVFVLAVAPASARNGIDDPIRHDPTSSSGSDADFSGSGMSSDDSNDVVEDETGDDSAGSQRGKELRQKALDKVSELRSEHKSKMSHTARQKVCENRQKTINNKLKAFNGAADKHLARLNDVFTKVQAYKTDNNLTVDNYDALVAAATTKQTAATEAVAALKGLGETVTCSSDDPAASLQAVKTAAHDARQALKNYRKALKNLVVALHQAKDDSNDDSQSDGGDQ